MRSGKAATRIALLFGKAVMVTWSPGREDRPVNLRIELNACAIRMFDPFFTVRILSTRFDVIAAASSEVTKLLIWANSASLADTMTELEPASTVAWTLDDPLRLVGAAPSPFFFDGVDPPF